MKSITVLTLTALSLFCIQKKACAQNQIVPTLMIDNTPIIYALESVMKLQPEQFRYNHKNYKQLALPTGIQYGFSAQAVKQLFPTAITQEKRWYKTGKNQLQTMDVDAVDLEKLIPFLVSAIQQQQQEINTLKQALKPSKPLSVK